MTDEPKIGLWPLFPHVPEWGGYLRVNNGTGWNITEYRRNIVSGDKRQAGRPVGSSAPLDQAQTPRNDWCLVLVVAATHRQEDGSRRRDLLWKMLGPTARQKHMARSLARNLSLTAAMPPSRCTAALTSFPIIFDPGQGEGGSRKERRRLVVPGPMRVWFLQYNPEVICRG